MKHTGLSILKTLSANATFGESRDNYRCILAFLGLNFPLILLILLINTRTAELSWIRLLYISNLALGYYVLPLIIITMLIFLLFLPIRRFSVWACFSTVILFIYFLLLDSYVYSIFKLHIDPFWMEFALRDYSGLGITRSTTVAFIAIFLCVTGVEVGVLVLASRFVPFKRLIRVFPLLVLLAFAISQVIHIVSYERNDERITGLTPKFPVYRPFTSHRYAAKYGHLIPLDNDAMAKMNNTNEKASFLYPSEKIRFDARPKEALPDIIIILLESWRYDALSQKLTPNIYSFGRDSDVFMNHLSTGNQTTCGIFGLFYGLHPTYWPTVKANSASIDNPVLIDFLMEHDYEFGIFAKSNFKRHKIKDTIFNGIQVHETFSGNSIPEEDMDMTDQIMDFIAEKSRNETPYLALAFYKSTHAPYEYPADRAIFQDTKNVGLSLSKNTDPTPYLNDYHNSVHFVDELVGKIIEKIKTSCDLGKTVVLITTDHGESFNEQQSNFWGHGSNFTRNQVQVPFILHMPGRAPCRIDRRTSHIDLVPTLFQDLFGCTNDSDTYSNGINLFSGSQISRPMVIGSYVTHSYIFDDNVYESVFAYTRKYKMHDLYEKASPLSPDQVKSLIYETNRFIRQ